MKIDYEQWKSETKWESEWWGNCVNTLREELLQIAYAKRMGITFTHNDRSPYNIDCGGGSVLDIGGGPVSLLLKCFNFSRAYVVDPCKFPHWVEDRYRAAGIQYVSDTAEDIGSRDQFTEVWIYNVLQHTLDPRLIIDNAKRTAQTVRLFEFIDAGIAPGHPHELHEADLNEWLGTTGTTEEFREHGAVGKVYYATVTK